MGYYVSMEIGGKLKPSKIEELRKKMEQMRIDSEKPCDDYNDRNIVWEEFLFMAEIENGYLVFSDYNCKFDGYEDFISFIAPYLEPQDITFVGEDDARWGWRIKDDGSIVELRSEWVEVHE